MKEISHLTKFIHVKIKTLYLLFITHKSSSLNSNKLLKKDYKELNKKDMILMKLIT